jgi:hypothetical protein
MARRHAAPVVFVVCFENPKKMAVWMHSNSPTEKNGLFYPVTKL